MEPANMTSTPSEGADTPVDHGTMGILSTPIPPAEPPSDIKAAALKDVAARRPDSRPDWVDKYAWSVLGKIVAMAVLVTVGVLAFTQLRHLLGVLAIALFFALAMIPGVEALVRRFNMRRGAAVGIIYAAAVVAIGLMIAVLIPGVVRFAKEVSAHASEWFAHLDAWSDQHLGTDVIDTGSAEEGATAVTKFLQSWGDNVLGAVTSGFSLIFDLVTIAAFAFYFAAGFPGLMRAVMRRMPPERQRVFRWVTLTSIQQTGGYFYSRLLIMSVSGATSFVVMAAIGLDLIYAAPLAVFMAFVSTFIPFFGTYLGAAVPILITLAVEGLVKALILLAWVLVYQQIENYVLSPRLSAKTMELSGSVAFGSALAGGALAGPMGAFMALPVAAMITAVIKNTGRTYAVIEEELDMAAAAKEAAPEGAAAEVVEADGVVPDKVAADAPAPPD